MLIQPVQNVLVAVKIGQDDYICQLVSLSEHKLELKSNEYLEQDSTVSFFAKYFRGHAIIQEIKFLDLLFTYHMSIQTIKFQPGLLINTRL